MWLLNLGLAFPHTSAESALVEVPSLTAFFVSLNLHRRHLNESQRAMVAGKLANMRQGERTDVEPSANLPDVVSQPEAAKLLNVSERSVRTAKKVQEKAVPELSEKVSIGEAVKAFNSFRIC
jgi:hypothetical protein